MKNEKLKRVKELRGIMLGLEMSLNLMEQDLDEVDKELCYLRQMKKDLLYNINLHKSGTVITVIREYKRSVNELKYVKEEIVRFKNHKDMLQKKIESKLKSYEYYLGEYEKAYDSLNSESVILLFRKDKNEQEK